MKMLNLSATVALLLFVAATVGLLIAQQTSAPVGEVASDSQFPEPVAGAGTDAADGTSPRGNDTAEVGEMGESGTTVASAEVAGETRESPCVVDAIYFHNTVRCYTCKSIEATARAALEAEFPRELANGRLRWSAINMEEQRHYVDQYDLVKPTLILSRSIDDIPQDWVALDEAWSLIGREASFSAYVTDSALKFLEGCP